MEPARIFEKTSKPMPVPSPKWSRAHVVREVDSQIRDLLGDSTSLATLAKQVENNQLTGQVLPWSSTTAVDSNSTFKCLVAISPMRAAAALKGTERLQQLGLISPTSDETKAKQLLRSSLNASKSSLPIFPEKSPDKFFAQFRPMLLEKQSSRLLSPLSSTTTKSHTETPSTLLSSPSSIQTTSDHLLPRSTTPPPLVPSISISAGGGNTSNSQASTPSINNSSNNKILVQSRLSRFGSPISPTKPLLSHLSPVVASPSSTTRVTIQKPKQNILTSPTSRAALSPNSSQHAPSVTPPHNNTKRRSISKLNSSQDNSQKGKGTAAALDALLNLSSSLPGIDSPQSSQHELSNPAGPVPPLPFSTSSVARTLSFEANKSLSNPPHLPSLPGNVDRSIKHPGSPPSTSELITGGDRSIEAILPTIMQTIQQSSERVSSPQQKKTKAANDSAAPSPKKQKHQQKHQQPKHEEEEEELNLEIDDE